MANITLTPQVLPQAGVAPTYNAGLTTTDTYLVRNNGGKTFLHFKKTGAGICTVTVVTPATVRGLALADQTVSVPATTGDVMVPLDPSLYDDVNHDVSFTMSDITGLTVAVIQLP
jgi:hypothetical protein